MIGGEGMTGCSIGAATGGAGGVTGAGFGLAGFGTVLGAIRGGGGATGGGCSATTGGGGTATGWGAAGRGVGASKATEIRVGGRGGITAVAGVWKFNQSVTCPSSDSKAASSK